MTPHRHPSEAILTDYASGAQRPAFAAVTAAHLEACPQCRRDVGLMEQVGGELISELAPVAMAGDSLAHALARIERPMPVAAPGPRPPTALGSGVVGRIGFRRRRWIAPGMWIAKAHQPGEDLLYLLRLPAGLPTMPHGHNGLEYTTVLQGSFTDAEGRVARGDFAETHDDVHHQPVVGAEGPCICLIASEKPMRMNNWVGHLVHALTGV